MEPENDIEIRLLKMTSEQDTFLFHYQYALEAKIDPNATFVSIIDDTNFPETVKVKYQITKGMGK